MTPALTLIQIGPVGDLALQAQAAEGAGYARFWCSQHYGHARSGSPILAAAGAGAATSSLRVGSAAVLVQHARPVQVVADAALVSLQTEGRFDLGIAAATAEPAVVGALAESHVTFQDDAAEVAALLAGDHELSAWAGPSAVAPELWICGASERSAAVAAALGAGLAHGPISDATAQALARYRREFRAGRFAGPKVSLLARGYCGGTGGEARTWWKQVAASGAGLRADFLGGPGECVEQLLTLAETWGADEVALAHVGPDVGASNRSAVLVAKRLS